MKKPISIILCLCFLALLGGCTVPGTNIGGLLTPPKLSGEIPAINSALEAYVGTDVLLKNPSSGEYRSAYVLYDTDGNYQNEAFVFYSKLSDDTTSNEIHMNFIIKDSDGWKTVNDVLLDGNTVDSVGFFDINNDGLKEIFVSLNTFGQSRKKLEIYMISDKDIKQCFKENHSVYSVLDINSDGEKEVLTLNLTAEEKTSVASAYKISNQKYTCIGNCALDGNITSYSAPIISKLKNGKPAVFVDAQKSADMLITEIIYWDKGLKAPLYDSVSTENHITLRSSALACSDIDNDGFCEIPFTETANSNNYDATKVYAVQWRAFDSAKFKTSAVTLQNYGVGYSVTIPNYFVEEGENKSIYFENNANENTCILYYSTSNKKNKGIEVLRIKCFGASVFKYSSEGYEKIIESDDIVYAVRINTDKITVEEIKQNFKLLNLEG